MSDQYNRRRHCSRRGCAHGQKRLVGGMTEWNSKDKRRWLAQTRMSVARKTVNTMSSGRSELRLVSWHESA